MATKYLSTGLLQPNCLDSRSASQVAQQCKPACGYTINQPGLGDSEDECLEKLLQVRSQAQHPELSIVHRMATHGLLW